jgi:hypothetical protein
MVTGLVEGDHGFADTRNNTTPVVLNVEGTLYIAGNNTCLARHWGADLTITGGGLVHFGWQSFFGNGQYWDGDSDPNSRCLVTGGTTLGFYWTAYMGRCVFPNCVLTGNAVITCNDKEGSTTLFYNVTDNTNPNGRHYGRPSGINGAVIFGEACEIRNGSTVGYAQGTGSSVSLLDDSIVTDAGMVLMFREDNWNVPAGAGRSFTVDGADYVSTSTSADIRHLQVGGDDGSFSNNWIVVRNGGTFSFNSTKTMNFGATVDVEVPNGIEVDGAAFMGGTLNLRANSALEIKGAGAAVTLDALTCSDTTQGNEPTVKITVPAESFGDAPLTLGALGAGMNLVVDMTAFSAATATSALIPLLAVEGDVADLNTNGFWNDITVYPVGRVKGLSTKTVDIDSVAHTLLYLNTSKATLILVK